MNDKKSKYVQKRHYCTKCVLLIPSYFTAMLCTENFWSNVLKIAENDRKSVIFSQGVNLG